MLTITSDEYLHPVQTDATTVYSLDQLREIILPLVELFGMRWARVFGSYARGEADGSSDIDVLVDKGDARYLDVSDLAGEIYDATGKRSDVFDITELKPGAFRDTVLREAVLL